MTVRKLIGFAILATLIAALAIAEIIFIGLLPALLIFTGTGILVAVVTLAFHLIECSK